MRTTVSAPGAARIGYSVEVGITALGGGMPREEIPARARRRRSARGQRPGRRREAAAAQAFSATASASQAETGFAPGGGLDGFLDLGRHRDRQLPGGHDRHLQRGTTMVSAIWGRWRAEDHHGGGECHLSADSAEGRGRSPVTLRHMIARSLLADRGTGRGPAALANGCNLCNVSDPACHQRSQRNGI